MYAKFLLIFLMLKKKSYNKGQRENCFIKIVKHIISLIKFYANFITEKRVNKMLYLFNKSILSAWYMYICPPGQVQYKEK
jgi:hypothetical protein